MRALDFEIYYKNKIIIQYGIYKSIDRPTVYVTTQ